MGFNDGLPIGGVIDEQMDGDQDEQVLGGYRMRVPRVPPELSGAAQGAESAVASMPGAYDRARARFSGASAPAAGAQPSPEIAGAGAAPIQPAAQRPADKYVDPYQQRIDAKMTEKAQASQPNDVHDKKYRMGIGMRILGSLANAMQGFGGHGGEPVHVGPGALNNRYYQDEGVREKRLAALGTELTDLQKEQEEGRKQYGTEETARARNETAAARQQSAQAAETTAEARKDAAEARKQLDEQNLADVTYDANTKRFVRNGKTYLPKTIEQGATLEAAFGINGYYTKLWGQERKNQPATPRQPTELELWQQAFKSEHGRAPNADEIVQRKQINRTTFKDKAGVDKYSNDWYDKERKGVDQAKKNWKSLNPDASEQEAQHGYQAIENQYRDRAAKFEQEKQGYYDQTGGGARTANPPARNAQSAPTQQTQKAGKDYTHYGKNPRTQQRIGSDDGVKWYDVKTGKPYQGTR